MPSAKHDPYFDYSNIPISTTTSWARPVHRARKRERSERPGGVIPGFCRSDRPGLEDRTSRGARLRPGTGPAPAQPGPAAPGPTTGSNPPSVLASTLVTTRHVRPAATRVGYRDMRGRGLLLLAGLLVAAAWVLLFVLITTFFPA